MGNQAPATPRPQRDICGLLIISVLGLCGFSTLASAQTNNSAGMPTSKVRANAANMGSIQKNQAMQHNVHHVMVSLLNRKIARIDARLARTNDPEEKARLRSMRRQLDERIAASGRVTNRMLSTHTPTPRSSLPPSARPARRR